MNVWSKLMVAVMICCFSSNLRAQTDTEFWFAAPDLEKNHGDRPISLRVSTTENAANITVSQPANPGFPVLTFSVPANASFSYDLTTYIAQIENSNFNVADNRGLLIKSDQPVSVYYDITSGGNGDMYALKGANALGNKFTIPLQMDLNNWTNPGRFSCDFIIVATEDGTVVNITPTADLVGHAKGQTFSVTLQKGETYTCSANSNLGYNKPGGTLVTSNKPISISTKDDSVQLNGLSCADTAGDQLIPDRLAGLEFIILKGYMFAPPNVGVTRPDLAYIFAIEDGTVINTSTFVNRTLNKGEFYTIQLNDESIYVLASKPVHIFQVSGFGCEVGGAVIPSLKCTGSAQVTLTRATRDLEKFYVNILAPADIINDFTVPGSTLAITASRFSLVNGSGGKWMYAKIDVSTAELATGLALTIRNTSGKFHVGVIQGGPLSTARFGYFSDFGTGSVLLKDPANPNVPLADNKVFCFNTNAKIQAVETEANMTFNWTGPNGFSSNSSLLNIPNFNIADTGTYKIAISSPGCGISKKDFRLLIDKPRANFNFSTSHCVEDQVSFTTPKATFTRWVWDFGNGNTLDVTNPVIAPVQLNAGLNTIKLKVASAKGCLGEDTVGTIELDTKPMARYKPSAITCEKGEITFTDLTTVVRGSLNKWGWDLDDGIGYLEYNNNQPVKTTYSTAGIKQVKLVVKTLIGCVSDTFVLDPFTVHPLPVAGFINPEVCLDDAKAIFTDTTSSPDGYKVFSYLWDFNAAATPAAPGPIFTTANTTEQNPAVKYQKIGPYQVKLTVTARGCSSSVVQSFKVYGANPIPEFSVVPAAFFCSNDSVRIINNSTIDLDNVARLIIHWDDTDPTLQSLIEDPVIGKTYAFRYPVFQAPLNKPTNIRLQAFSGESLSCSKSVTKTIELKSAPKVTFNDMPGICLNADPRLVSEASSDIRVPGTLTFSGNGVSSSGLFTPTTTGVGTFPIRALFTSVYGCKDSADKNITVWPIPTADFSNSNITCETDLISFTSSSQANAGSLAQWTWNFGDNTPDRIAASEDPVTHAFGSYNTYNVSLRVKTDNGCISEPKTIPIKVHPKPRVDFSLPNVCLPQGKAIFNNLSNIPEGDANAIQYKWNYGNAASSGTNGLHYFTSISNYPVKLVATSAFKCKDSSTKILSTIFKQPKAAFNALDSICIGKNISFTDQSTTPDGNINQWFWNLDDGNKSTQPNPDITYKQSGIKTITFHAQNDLGCYSDTISKKIEVFDYPKVNAGPDLKALDDVETIIPAIAEGRIVSYAWTPSTYLSATDVLRPRIIHPDKDLKYVLTVTGRGGCVSIDSMQMEALLSLEIPNTFTPNGDGNNDTWKIKNISKYSYTVIELYNSAGQSVGKLMGATQEWDGTLKGNPLPTGTYYYVIDTRAGRKRKAGYVTILR